MSFFTTSIPSTSASSPKCSCRNLPRNLYSSGSTLPSAITMCEAITSIENRKLLRMFSLTGLSTLNVWSNSFENTTFSAVNFNCGFSATSSVNSFSGPSLNRPFKLLIHFPIAIFRLLFVNLLLCLKFRHTALHHFHRIRHLRHLRRVHSRHHPHHLSRLVELLHQAVHVLQFRT